MIIFLVVGLFFLLMFIYSCLVVAKRTDEYNEKLRNKKRWLFIFFALL